MLCFSVNAATLQDISSPTNLYKIMENPGKNIISKKTTSLSCGVRPWLLQLEGLFKQFTNRLLSVLKSWEGGGFICCLACFHDKKLMCSDICFLRLPAFKEFFDLDKAVRGEEPYLFCSYSTLDGTGNKCSILQLRFPHWRELSFQWVAELVQIFWHIIFCRDEKVCAWLEFVFSQLWVFVGFCCSPCTCCSVLSGAAKQNLAQSRVCVCWKEKFQYSKFQSVLININMNTPPFCLSMCSKWNENHEEIGKQFCPRWSKHSCWPQQGSSCGQGCAWNWEFGEPEQ